MSLLKSINKYIADNNIRKYSVGEKLGNTQPTFYYVMNGKRGCSIIYLTEVAEAIGCLVEIKLNTLEY